MGEADLTEGLVGSYLLPEQLGVAPAQALAPEIAAFRTGVFSPQPLPIKRFVFVRAWAQVMVIWRLLETLPYLLPICVECSAILVSVWLFSLEL